MGKLLRKKWFWAAAVVALLALAAVSPSFSYVNVKNADGTSTTIQRSGFGPQTVRVETGDMKAEATGW